MDDIVVTLNPQYVIADCLETAFGLKTYKYLIDTVSGTDFVASPSFRKVFNGYYKVRQRKTDWYDAYYKLMEEQKTENRSFEEVLEELAVYKSVEVSFSSKLIATVDPAKPIWDQYVIHNLGLDMEWNRYQGKNMDVRIKKANDIYNTICEWYHTFLNTKEGEMCVAVFNEAVPKYADISDVKKIDFMLTSRR